MFGIGGGEFLVIALVALIAVGPEQLPSVMRKFGGYVGQLRNMADGVRGDFMAGVDELDPVKWTGDGSDEKPIVPRGFAGPPTTPDGEPVVKPTSATVASKHPTNQPFDNKVGATTNAPAAPAASGDGPTDGSESAPPVNAIAAGNARPTPEPDLDEADLDGADLDEPAPDETTARETAPGEVVVDEVVPAVESADQKPSSS